MWRRSAVLVALAGVVLALPGAAAASSAGALYAFGSNTSGQLGSAMNSGTSNPNPTPAPASLPGATGPVVGVAGGGLHSLALTATGQLYAFGQNAYGQLGVATNSGTSDPNPTPAPVPLPGATGAVTQVAAGNLQSLALTATGQLYAFGENRFGQLGNPANNGTANPNPNPTPVSLPGASGVVVQIAAGGYHDLVLTATGQLYAFGLNNFGQLGVEANSGTSNPNPEPMLVSLPGASSPVVQIAAGRFHSLALTANGQLYAFGQNGLGQLGFETNNGTANPNPKPAPILLPGATGPVTQVAAGGSHSLALTAPGQLYAFGDNHHGQLGSVTNLGTTNPRPAPVLLPAAGGPVVQIAAGLSDSLALTASGQLYAFGQNLFGQLGIPTNSGTGSPNPTLTPVALPGGESIDTVASGSQANHSLVVIADLSVANGSLAGGAAGLPYRERLQVAGGASPYRWSVSGLPAGLAIDAASGEVSGTPAHEGSSSATFTVTDRFGITASKTLVLSITMPPPLFPAPPPSITLPPSLTAPALSRLDVSPRRLSLAGRFVRGRCVAPTRSNRDDPRCRQKLRLRVRFQLDAAATVRLDFARLRAGRGASARTVGSPIVTQRAIGVHTLAIARPALPPGRYRLTVTPSTPGHRGTPQTATITIS